MHKLPFTLVNGLKVFKVPGVLTPFYNILNIN